MPRKYDMTKRKSGAEKTKERIVKSTEHLLATRSLAEVTLPAIAKGANVTVQTVIRKMGSRDGCLDEVAKLVSERVESQRGHTNPGDVDSALSTLMQHYESESALILNLLEQANNDETFVKMAIERGRIYHRKWVEHSFGSLIEVSSETLDALVAATDIYLYKLLRLDMGRSFNATKAVINRLVRGILEIS